jgi:predicted ABC-type transport system involved in lysophospholipase L1 biosynthesis ATPase subunit
MIREEGLGALIATHNVDFARRMSRVVRLTNGTLVED